MSHYLCNHTHARLSLAWVLMEAADQLYTYSCRRERLAALEQQHGHQWTAHLLCRSFMQGLAELCLYKVQTIQCLLGDLSRTYMFCLMLQKHIGSQRQQHRKLDRHLLKMGTKMDASIQQLLAWLAQLRQHRHYLRLDDQVVADGLTATRVSCADGELCL